MKQIIFFSLGAACGASIAWYLTKRHYENFIFDEIDDIRESYEEERQEIKDEKIYRAKVRNLNYISEDVIPIDEDKVDENGVLKDEDRLDENPLPGEPVDEPYAIGPDAYHDETIFDKCTVTYYTESDVLVTDEDEIIEPELIGDGLDHFDEYEMDTSFVRNEKMGQDFEIIRVNGAYEPVE